MKYIFVAGAPGSKWSSVVKNIYYSPSVDRSDYADARTYYHDASGTVDLMHLGAYFDPGMEFGGFFDRLNDYTREECEQEFDRPFTGTGVRIIKSHVFCHHIDFIKSTWPDSPLVLVHRPDDACLGWWVKCGHFGITYPLYRDHYQNLRKMSQIIAAQNHDLTVQGGRWPSRLGIRDNRELCKILNLDLPPSAYLQNYQESDIKVKVI